MFGSDFGKIISKEFYLIVSINLSIIISLGKIKELHKYLENNIFLEKRQLTEIIETFYGCAISANNIQIISLLNLFVRENNIKINKLNVIEEIYYADFRYEYDKKKLYGFRIELGSFNNKIQQEYICKYWSMFN